MAIGSKKDADEYQLPSDDLNEQADFEQPSEEPMAPPRRNRFIAIFRQKKVLILLGLIIAIIVVYEFVGTTGEQRQPQSALLKTTQPKINLTDSQLTSLASQNQELQSSISTLAQQINANKNDITQLESGLSELASSQQQLTNQIANINTGLQRLSLQLEKLAAKPKTPVKRVVKYIPPSPIFYLRAILPGRAWLQSNQGQLVTVTLGDKLNGYGTITWINPELGAVNTSSGKVIRYGVNDY